MLSGQQLPGPVRSADTPLVDPMPAQSLADGCLRRGLWRPAPVARAAGLSAAALIGSFSTRVMRRWGRSCACGPADAAVRPRWPKLRDPAPGLLVTRTDWPLDQAGPPK